MSCAPVFGGVHDPGATDMPLDLADEAPRFPTDRRRPTSAASPRASAHAKTARLRRSPRDAASVGARYWPSIVWHSRQPNPCGFSFEYSSWPTSLAIVG